MVPLNVIRKSECQELRTPLKKLPEVRSRLESGLKLKGHNESAFAYLNNERHAPSRKMNRKKALRNESLSLRAPETSIAPFLGHRTLTC